VTVANSSHFPNPNRPGRIPYWGNENWGWTAVGLILASLLAAIAIYSPPDLADRSASVALGDHETLGQGTTTR
jgi:hypothetical protein